MTPSETKDPIPLAIPLDAESIEALHKGDSILISGALLCIEEEAGRQLAVLLDEDSSPVVWEGAAIYFAGPTPPKAPRTVGASEANHPVPLERLFEKGVRAVIGVGLCGQHTAALLSEKKCVCLRVPPESAAQAGAAVKKTESIPISRESGASIDILHVECFPAVVSCDSHGGEAEL